RLVLGQSLFTWLDDDGRVHHKFFSRGRGDKARLFKAWLPTVERPHYRVTVRNALQAAVFWLASEHSSPPLSRDLAREIFKVRAPSLEQTTFAGALFDGFLLGHDGWTLWEHVGQAIRRLPDQFLLERCSDELRKRFRKVDVFH